MTICPVCGKEVGNEKFCSNCGSAIGNDDNSSGNPQNSKFCTNCGSQIDIMAEICPKCGVKQNSQGAVKDTKYCTNCGSEINFKAELCPNCGVRQTSSVSSEKNVWVAVLLSLLIVGLGHFYLGLPKKGALLLIITVISWALIAVAIGIVLYPLVLIYGIYDVYQSAIALSEGRHVEDSLFGF